MVDQTFRRFADDYNFWIQHQPDPEAFTRIAKLAKGLERVLDVGSGDGLLTVELARVAQQVVGVDLSPTMIDRARQRAADAGCQNVEFIQADINALEMPPASFDLIVSSFALHHTDPRVTVPTLVGLLRPGGMLYLQEPVCPVTGPLARRLWYRRQGLHDLPAILQQHGLQTAWRVTRFRQSRTWIEHQIQDGHWTPAAARACYQSLLPGAIIHEAPAADLLQVMWQRPPASPAAPHPGATIPTPSPAALPEHPIAVGRTYPRPAPTGYVPFPRTALTGSVIARFEEQVKRHEAKSAVCTATQQLSYGELNSTANRWARRLLGEADATTASVAILMDQDDPVIPAIFGTLKARKAYVVIDPADPPERQARILALTGATNLLTTAARMQQASQWQPAPQQILIAEEIVHDPDQGNLELPLGPDQLAAIFFTSGSTGEPKGIARDHRQFLHSTWLNTNTYYVAPADRQSLLYFPGFTASVPNIYDTLLNGATLCSLNPRHLAPADLLAWLQREAITHFNPPIGLFRGLLEAVTPAMTWPDLRLITLGGQPLYGKDIRDFQRSFGANTVLLYVLAMTEAGAITQGYIDHQTVAGEGPLPVGYPVADKEITIVNEAGEPAPSGTVGQLMVTSPYLSLGQWEEVRAVKQQASFTREAPQPRRFLTSDRGRFRDDGALEFYGRSDAVVKLRGYRVDLGAIETVLNSLPAIQTAVVAALPMLSSEKRLVAYVVPQTGCELSVNDLKQTLQQQLPRYMIPEQFEVLTHLPLTASGKIDRQALPRLGQARPELSTPYVAPRNPTEAQLVTLWEELFDLRPIGVHDDFFALGGHSLALLQLATWLQQHFGQAVSLNPFVQEPTIEKLAHLLKPSRAEHPLPRVQQTGEDLSPVTEADMQRITPFLLGKQGAVQPPTGQPPWHNRWLPFATRVRLLYQMCRSPLMQRRFFPQERRLLHTFLPLMGVEPAQTQKVVATYLMRRLCRRHYRTAVTHTLWHNMQQAVVLSGQNFLAEARQSGRGILLLNTHGVTPAGEMLPILLQQLGYADFMLFTGKSRLQNNPALRKAFQQYFAVTQDELVISKFLGLQMDAAQQKLRVGGIVSIAPDGRSGQLTLSLPVCGRERAFSTGFADLSIETGAVAIPTRCVILPTGKIQVTFLPPLDSGAADAPRQERIHALVEQYVAFLEATWKLDPANIAPRHIKFYLED
jgi:acyl-coenzyme A synthetase/AMP-(fatty) acid ligase/ubiquinone/menaquinone biosynthesis C-methylase UbiE/lauroyl/myristoyl acyltransferase